MKLGRAGLVTAVCWSLVTTVFASCSDEQSNGTGQAVASGGVPGGTGAGGPGGPGAGTGGSSGDPRIDYCKEITKYCVDDPDNAKHNQMYTTESNCRDVAMFIPAGTAGDSVGDSIACRRHYLQFAPEDPDLNCAPAGPASFEGKCGGVCEDFCALSQKICTGDKAMWPSENACKQDCNKWSQTSPYFVTDQGGPEGNNLACRLYQLVRGDCGDIGVDSEACVDPPPPRDGGPDVGPDVEDAGDDGGIMDAGDPDAADSAG